MKIKHTALFNEAGDGGNEGGGTLLSSAAGASSTATTTTTTGNPAAAGGDEHGGTAYDFRTSLDDKGNFRPDWTSGLPADLRDHASVLAKYPNPVEMARGLANAQKMIGQKSTLKAPAPDAKPEEVEKFNSQIRGVLGIPDKVEDYKVAKPEKLPEGITWDESKASEFAKLAHSLNIPPAAANKIAEWQMNHLGSIAEQGKAKLDEWVKAQDAELRKDWGSDFDVNLGKAAKAAQIAGFDLNDPELGNNAKFVKAMLTVSNLIKPDAFVGADKAGVTMDGAAQAEDIRRNPSNPWHAAYMGREGASRQKEAQAVMARLQGVKLAA